ncbi:MAG: VOC family protein [Candidatus Bathyarchaeota archaeon]|jgi:catechol 2,3-dioxygenase-like lactoylglutathione lyase family enzyme
MAVDTVLDHLLIVSEDLERSIEFYELLGFEHLMTIQRPNDKLAILQLGETKIELMSLPKGKETRRPPRRRTDLGFRHIGFRIDNVEAAYERLKNRIDFDSPPRKIAGRGDRITVFFRDPDGVEIHFVQE